MIMNTRQNRLIIFALLLLTQTPLGAQLHSTKIELPEDSISATMEDSIPAKRSFFKKFLDYFNDANKEKKNKKFDFSVIGGPHYSSDTKFGLGLVAAGLYRTDRNDSLLPPSNVSLYGDVSTVGFYLLGVRGNHLFPQDKYRLNINNIGNFLHGCRLTDIHFFQVIQSRSSEISIPVESREVLFQRFHIHLIIVGMRITQFYL